MIKLILGDITILEVDAIVNAANSKLLGGGGVDGAIHRAAGKKLLDECRTLGGCQTGEAKISGAYDLPAKYVIHTVGPIYGRNPLTQKDLLKSCYINSLEIAIEYDCSSVAFPNISTGVYGYPKPEAAQIAMEAVKTFLKESEQAIEVNFVCFDSENYSLYKSLL